MYQEDFHLSHNRHPPPPQIAAVTHGKRTKSTISSNLQSLPALITFEPSEYVRLANHRAQPRFDSICWRHLVYRWTVGVFQFLSLKVIHAD